MKRNFPEEWCHPIVTGVGPVGRREAEIEDLIMKPQVTITGPAINRRDVYDLEPIIGK